MDSPGVNVRRERMVVRYEVIAVVLMLQGNPVFQRTDKMSQMEFPGGTHAAQNGFPTGQRASGNKLWIQNIPHEAGSVEEQVRLPPLIERPHEVTDKRHMIRSHCLSAQRHQRLLGGAVPFLVVTAHACTCQILPSILPSPGNWCDMIDGEWDIAPATILASVAVTTEDVFPREDNLLERNPNVHREANNAREWQRHRHRADTQRLICSYQLDLPHIQKHNCLLHVNHAHRLIILIEDQHLCIQAAVVVARVYVYAEVASLLTVVLLNKSP